jgi:hypothetical protein
MSKIQPWSCEQCQQEGTVQFDEHADVFTVANLIEDDHKRVSPNCDCPVRKIRLGGLSVDLVVRH